MKVLSSSVERCIASLTSFMAGFLPPPATDKTLPISWQSFPFAVDNEARVLTINPAACAKYQKDYIHALNTIDSDPTVRNWMAQDKAIIKKVGDFVGQSLTTFNDVSMAAETIRTQQFLDANIPTWAISAYAGPLKKYFIRYADLYHETELMKKVRGGPMITQVVDNMVAMRNNNSTARNVMIFSAHDFTLHSMITVLNVKSQVPQVAAYGDTIAIELHQTGTNEPEVQVYYYSNSANLKFMILLHVPGCGNPCRLSTFNNLVSKYLVRDFDAMCRL